MLWGVVVSAMLRLVGCRMLIASHNKLLESAASTDAALVKRSRQERYSAWLKSDPWHAVIVVDTSSLFIRIFGREVPLDILSLKQLPLIGEIT